MKLTGKQISEIKDLMKKHIDLESTTLRTNLDDHRCHKIFGTLQFKLPYGFRLTKYGTTYLEFNERDFVNKDIVDQLFTSIVKSNNKRKHPSQKLVNELIDHLDFNDLIRTAYLKSWLTSFYMALHSYEISNIKQFNGQLFGRPEIKDFLKKHNQFKIVTNIAVQDSKNIALASVNDKDVLSIYLTEYLKLFMFLEDAVIDTNDTTVML